MLEENIFLKIIKELCEELDIKIEKKSCDWIYKLTKNEKNEYIIGKKFPLNSESSSAIVSDKYATFEILESFDIPVVKHILLFNPKTRTEYMSNEENKRIIDNEFSRYGNLVVKPNFGSEGRGVTLCKTLDETKNAIDSLFETNNSISLCPYYDIKKEYRAFYLNGKILLIYGKTKPFVIGNGVYSLRELIANLNLPEKTVVKENLMNLDMNMIPEDGQKIEISWKHNLSGGATAEILEKGELYNKIERLSKEAGKAVSIKFATIDIIHTTDNKLYVLEINSSVGTTIFTQQVKDGYVFAKEIYKEALKEIF